jgi:hypothetical protein
MEPIVERTITNVGARYTAGDRLAQVEEQIEALEWHELPDDGALSAPFMPGEAIKAAIAQLRLPKVSRIAWNGALAFHDDPEQDGEYPGLCGIEANYRNGRARVYIVDNGTEILPVVSDFWPKVPADAGTATA